MLSFLCCVVGGTFLAASITIVLSVAVASWVGRSDPSGSGAYILGLFYTVPVADLVGAVLGLVYFFWKLRQ